MQKVIEVLASPTVRRLAVFLIGLGVTALHKRFGLEMDAAEIYGTVLMVLGYVGQSAFTDASKTRSDAMLEASKPAAAAPPVGP